ncbi:hypothetical protein LTR94_031922, partial [Friedmanniomyces endolithicus]
VRQLLWPGPSPFRSLTGTISLERSRLSVEPLTLGLTRGTLSGRIGVDQRDGGPLLDIAMAPGETREDALELGAARRCIKPNDPFDDAADPGPASRFGSRRVIAGNERPNDDASRICMQRWTGFGHQTMIVQLDLPLSLINRRTSG